MLLSATALPPRPAIHPTCWIHGDFHPDQVLLGDAPRLLDLDDLRPGAPEEDLAQWIVDHIVAGADPREAREQFQAAYRAAGKAPIAPALLHRLLVATLVERAAACVRRLEVHAEERAREWVDCATRLWEAGQ
ncbi:MAG: phosphotransferase [Planctomycetota bacterium]